MRRTVCVAVALVLASACGGDGGDSGTAAPGGPTPTAEAVAVDPSCPQKPLTLTTDDRWQVTSSETTVASGVTGAVWQATFTFANPNNVDVALTFPTVILDILGPDGHHRSNGKTSPREQAGTARGGGSWETVSEVVVVPGHIPKTLSVYAATSAKATNGADCNLTIQGASPLRPASEFQNVKDCEPRIAPAAC